MAYIRGFLLALVGTWLFLGACTIPKEVEVSTKASAPVPSGRMERDCVGNWRRMKVRGQHVTVTSDGSIWVLGGNVRGTETNTLHPYRVDQTFRPTGYVFRYVQHYESSRGHWEEFSLPDLPDTTGLPLLATTPTGQLRIHSEARGYSFEETKRRSGACSLIHQSRELASET